MSKSIFNAVFFSVIIFFVLPVDRYAFGQHDKKNFDQETGKLREEVTGINNQIEKTIPATHELLDYFKESIGIIERLSGIIQKDVADGEWPDAEASLNEATFLSSFLKKELSVARKRDTAPYREINVHTFGIKGDGKTDNFPLLKDLLSTVKNHNGFLKLIFPEGNYRVNIEHGRNGIEVTGQSNIVFEGIGNVKFIFDGSNGGRNNLLIQNSKDIEFRNITIDMDPLPFTLGTIESIPGGNQIIVSINAGYPIPDKSYHTARYLRGLVRFPGNGKIKRDCGDPRIVGLEDLGSGIYKLTLDDNSLSGNQSLTTNFKEGDLFSIHPRRRPGAGIAVSIFNSEHLLFSGFNVRAADGHLFGIYGSRGVKFLDCDISPAKGRGIINNADGFHCQSNPKGIYMERCRVMDMNDDCLNFYARLASVAEVKKDKKFVVLVDKKANERATKFRAGGNIVFINSNTGDYDSFATIKSVNILPEWGGQKELLCITTTDPIPGIISRRSAGRGDWFYDREYTPSGGEKYKEAMSLNTPFEHMILNLGAKNDGFIVRDCEFGDNRATGFKCKATNGVVRNTRFYDQVVLFRTGLGWREGTYPSKIKMDNVVIDRGISYSSSLPGKQMSGKESVKFMKHVKFKNVVDSHGQAIPAPGDIK